MDASFLPVESGSNEAFSPLPPTPHTRQITEDRSKSKAPPPDTEDATVAPPLCDGPLDDATADRNNRNHPSSLGEDDRRNPPLSSFPSRAFRERTIDKNRNSTGEDLDNRSIRSASSPQLATTKPMTRSKVYRKASLKSGIAMQNLSLKDFCNGMDRPGTNGSTQNHHRQQPRIILLASKSNGRPRKSDGRASLRSGPKPELQPSAAIPIDPSSHRPPPPPLHPPTETGTEKGKDRSSHREERNDHTDKWNLENVRITCNPLSNPYPYSTPCPKPTSNILPEAQEEEPKSRSCGSFLPILALIPQTVISFHYLSPKMKFSWWRNKIS
ncbi:uncharacterized protein [Prorops nasuta]|uniref:uncharacterized protein n=1 Tax=Prorops nasuta TaxID=863751 RepID=UPI0034CEC652